MGKPLQLIGLCRFSYPSAPEAFKTRFSTVEQVRAHLYEPKRLEERFFFFENLMLPGIRAQTDPAFSFVVMAGDELPQAAKARLEQAVEGISSIQIAYMPEGEVHREICKIVMTGMRDLEGGPVAEFRLDDDDAVAVDFVERTRFLFEKIAPLFHANGRLCLDYCRGVLASFEPGGLRTTPVLERMWTPAQVIFRKPNDPYSLLSVNHMHLWHTMPTLEWPNKPMFVRGAHGHNDSHVKTRFKGMDALKAPDAETVELFFERFAVDLVQLQAGWAQFSR